LRHRLDAVAEAHALSAQARLSAVVVGAAPLGYLAFSAMVDARAVTALVGTGVGRVCLVAGLALEALAALWIRRILRSAG
jgi:Flp pilus assembly protein TadB